MELPGNCAVQWTWVSFSLLRCKPRFWAKQPHENRGVEMAGFNALFGTARIAREAGPGQSKKVMLGIKGIYSRAFWRYCRCADAPAARSRKVARKPEALSGSDSASSATVAENCGDPGQKRTWRTLRSRTTMRALISGV